MAAARLSKADFALRVIDLSPQETDVTGMNPHLVQGRNGDAIYLFAASPSPIGRIFDPSTKSWGSFLPAAPGMEGIDLDIMSCIQGEGYCWGGPDYFVDGNDKVHIVWSDRGTVGCNPNKPEWVHTYPVKHIEFDGSTWSSPPDVWRDRSDTSECAYQYPKAAEDGAGRFVVTFTLGIYLGTDMNYWDGVVYRVRDTAGNWSEDIRVSDWQAPATAAGGGGKLYVGYYGGAGQKKIAVIGTGSSAVVNTLSLPEFAIPKVEVAGSDVLHVHWVPWSNLPDPPGIWHSTGVAYDVYDDGWQLGDGLLLTSGIDIFSQAPEDKGVQAVDALALSPGGTRLMVFTYFQNLYAVIFDGTAWQEPVQLDIGEPALATDVREIGTDQYLIVWATAMQTDAQVHCALVDTSLFLPPGGEENESDAGTMDGPTDISADQDAVTDMRADDVGWDAEEEKWEEGVAGGCGCEIVG